ncbi:hypothetical protein [Halorientalis sp.]|uniref:hypothetical protein n=1 Tax=Halorientalis sp. TaxID=1931229 RepID=UPI0026067278|nr:hypothetical protein [Halorientalis sp.]
MSAGDIPAPAEYEWDFETDGDVGIWYLDGWQGFPDEELNAVSDHYRERASRDDIEATVAVFGDETSLPKETQEYMGEEWSANGEYAGVDRIGFVADGITGMAVKSNMDVSDAELGDFDDLSTAIEWAKN